MPSALRSSVRKPMPAAIAARRGRRPRAPADADRARGERVEAEDRARGLGAARAEQAAEPDDLAAAHREVDPRAGCERWRSPSASSSTSPWRARAAAELGHAGGLDVGDRAAEHVGDQRDLARLADGADRDGPAVAHHRDAVADREELVEEVRDVEHRDPGVAQPADHAEQHLDLAVVERGGGLVHDDEAGVERHRAGDGDELLDGGGILAERRAHVDGDAEAREDLAGAGVRGLPVDQAAAPRLVAHGDVLGHAAQRHQVQLLVDRGDAGVLRLARRGRPRAGGRRSSTSPASRR